MANEVKVIFSAEADGLFRVADQAKNRVQSIAAEADALNRSARAASVSVSGLAPQIAKARAETDKLRRSEEALARLRGTSVAGRGGPLSGESRYARINLARQGADVFTQLGSGQ